MRNKVVDRFMRHEQKMLCWMCGVHVFFRWLFGNSRCQLESMCCNIIHLGDDQMLVFCWTGPVRLLVVVVVWGRGLSTQLNSCFPTTCFCETWIYACCVPLSTRILKRICFCISESWSDESLHMYTYIVSMFRKRASTLNKLVMYSPCVEQIHRTV